MPKDESLRLSFHKEELNDLGALLEKAGALDDTKLFIAGFPNYKQGQNAIIANLLSGKKNLRFLAKKDELFYMLMFQKNEIVSYFSFAKAEIARVKVKKKLLSTAFRVELKDKSSYSVDVTVNKARINELKDALK